MSTVDSLQDVMSLEPVQEDDYDGSSLGSDAGSRPGSARGSATKSERSLVGSDKHQSPRGSVTDKQRPGSARRFSNGSQASRHTLEDQPYGSVNDANGSYGKGLTKFSSIPGLNNLGVAGSSSPAQSPRGSKSGSRPTSAQAQVTRSVSQSPRNSVGGNSLDSEGEERMSSPDLDSAQGKGKRLQLNTIEMYKVQKTPRSMSRQTAKTMKKIQMGTFTRPEYEWDIQGLAKHSGGQDSEEGSDSSGGSSGKANPKLYRPTAKPSHICTVKEWEVKWMVKENNNFKDRNRQLRSMMAKVHQEKAAQDKELEEMRNSQDQRERDYSKAAEDLKLLAMSVAEDDEIEDSDEDDEQSPDEQFQASLKLIKSKLSEFVRRRETARKIEKDNLILKRELMKIKRAQDKIDNEKNQLRDKVSSSEEKYHQLNHRFETLTAELKEVRSLNSSYKNENEENESLVKDLKGENGKLRGDVSKLKRELGDRNEKCEDLKDKVEDLEKKLKKAPKASLAEELKDMKKQIGRLENENEDLKSEKSELIDEKETMQEQVRRMEEKKETIEKQKVDLQSEIKKLRKLLEDKETRETELETSISDLSNANSKIQENLAKLKAEKNSEAEEKLKHAEEKIKEKDAEIERLNNTTKKDVKKLRSDVISLREEKVQLEADFDKIRNEGAKMYTELSMKLQEAQTAKENEPVPTGPKDVVQLPIIEVEMMDDPDRKTAIALYGAFDKLKDIVTGCRTCSNKYDFEHYDINAEVDACSSSSSSSDSDEETQSESPERSSVQHDSDNNFEETHDRNASSESTSNIDYDGNNQTTAGHMDTIYE